MSWFASSKLTEKGELIWERDIWNDGDMMELWMLLSDYQKWGVEMSERELVEALYEEPVKSHRRSKSIGGRRNACV